MFVLSLLLCAPHTLTIIGTADLHGRMAALPLFSGYVSNARAVKDRAVLLIDAGDAMQGTLESDMDEGATVIKAYGLLGYDALAVGNHEFDFGPVGPETTVRQTKGDPRGALKERAKEAAFPFLSANLRDKGAAVKWQNFKRSVIVKRDGLAIGVIGATTEDTPNTTIAANFVELQIAKTTAEVTAEAKALRKAGAAIIVLAAHIGDTEIKDVANALPAGSVDAIIAGHAHKGMFEKINGIPVVESFSLGKAFSRIDLTLDDKGKVSGVKSFETVSLEKGKDYEGAPVVEDAKIGELIAPALQRAEARKKELLGPTLDEPLVRSFNDESPLGNMIATMILRAEPKADIAIMNGGGIRTDLPKGPLTYGALYTVLPFNNFFAFIKQSGKATREMFERNAQYTGAILSIAGARVTSRCEGPKLIVEVFLVGADGKETKLDDAREVTLVTNDFIATGGDSILKDFTMKPAEHQRPMRDALAEIFRTSPPSFLPSVWFDPKSPRIGLPTKRPVACK